MSWNFKVVAANKAALKAAVAEEKAVAEYKYCPAPVVNAINAAVDGLPDSTVRDVCIETNGHVDLDENGYTADKGTPNFTIKAYMVDRPKEEVVVPTEAAVTE